MYYSRLLELQGLLNEQQIEQLDEYFAGLIGSAASNITVSKIVSNLELQPKLASQVLIRCKEMGFLESSYAMRCPECCMLIKRVSSLHEIPKECIECYNCNKEIEISPCNIEIIYALVDTSVFLIEQQNDYGTSARSVVQMDSMESIFLAGGVNSHLFHPTDDEYKELLRMYDAINNVIGTTKKIGDTLENLTKYLFNLCPAFCANGIRTTTNQIDCFVRNKMYLNYGIFNTIGARIFIECKNETYIPSGGYMSKLHSIISNTNAGGKGECVKLGIIISKEKGPSTFKSLAVKSYLADGIVMIAICGKELKKLFEDKGNLLDLIERKVSEIMMDSTTDLVQAGLYVS